MALERILAAKRDSVAKRMLDRPLASFRSALVPSDRPFAEALRRAGCAFILECKKASPSQGVLREGYDPAALASEYADVADAISVLADGPFFQGSLEDIGRARAAVQQPVLCKDFVVDPYQVFEARLHGADAVLLMLSVLDVDALRRCQEIAWSLGMDALVEVHDERELELALSSEATVIGVNNRDLRTLEVDLAVTEKLAPKIPDSVLRICESGIESREHVHRLRPLVDGFLVGSSMMRRPDIADAARGLAYGRVKVCGLTSVDDARAARKAGATFGGVIFATESPRCVKLQQAFEICGAVGLRWVGVFVNADEADVAEAASTLGLAAVQLHGEETPQMVLRLRSRLPQGCEIWKSWPVRDSIPLVEEVGADRLVLERHDPDRRGGTGRSFDWEVVRHHPQLDRFVLAGGLHPENAATAEQVGAWALDVNSGVEEAPGRKSPARLGAFFRALRRGSKA